MFLVFTVKTNQLCYFFIYFDYSCLLCVCFCVYTSSDKEINCLGENGHNFLFLLNVFFCSLRRISVIFRIRSAKAIKITDASLIKKLGFLCGFVSVALLIRTLVSPPDVVVGRTADNLKAFLCKTDWWDHSFTSSKSFIYLVFGALSVPHKKKRD